MVSIFIVIFAAIINYKPRNLVVLCERVKQLLTAQINKRLEDLREEGDFTDNMTQERLASIKDKAATEGAPRCPKCGAPMCQRTIRKGIHQGESFWGCTDFPKCDGTRRMQPHNLKGEEASNPPMMRSLNHSKTKG